MSRFFIKLFLLFVLQVEFLFVYAQVNVQDSLALVALYNSTGGPDWNHHENWLITPVSQWYGVELESGQVSVLNLANNNLVGTLPNEFCNFGALKYLYFDNNQIGGIIPSCIGSVTSINSFSFRNNQLTGAVPNGFQLMLNLADVWVSNNDLDDFPDLTGLPEISNMAIDGNRFTFEDIESNVAISNSSNLYHPQDEIGAEENRVVDIFSSFEFSVMVGGSNNVYQWYKDGEPIQDNERFSGSNTPILHNDRALLEDDGVYTCQVKNSVAVFLTLNSRAKHVFMNDNRLNDTVVFQNKDTLYCNVGEVPLFASSASALQVYYAISYGNALVTLQNDSTLTPMGIGVFGLRIYTLGDETYKPFSVVVPMRILSTYLLQDIVITHDLPIKEGGNLTLSVPDLGSGVGYRWETPTGMISNAYLLSINNIQKYNAGMYRVSLIDNQCVISLDTLEVVVEDNPTTLIIYELITPNGDGKNDVFYIENIENSPNTEVTIFNAWNQVVYHSTQYKNDWDGGGLPVGNYYYLVKEKDCRCEDHRGIVYIKK